MIKNSWILYLLVLTFIRHAHNVTIKSYARDVSKEFSTILTEYTKKVTRYHEIENEFKTIEKDLEFKKIDGKQLNDKFVSGLENLFAGKKKILEKIREKAVKSNKNYEVVDTIEAFNYLNIRKFTVDDNVSIAIDPKFSLNVKINKTNSFVQVPTNIYSENKAVLNTATWTSELDDVFKDNDNNSDSTLLYQYYGDSSGLFRVYPGNLNGARNKDGVDLFDCRRRIWYIQASSSPKDVVLVIDISGSMIGANIGIAKISAASLIDTLQENDYFNVIAVNNKVKYLQEEAKYLIQATKENKESMKQELQKLDKPADIVNISMGMKEAFDILHDSGEFYNRTSSAECNKAILFITDGVEGEYAGKDVFEERNKDRSVRAFAFLVGRRKNPDNRALIDMACNNRGYFYTIETLGNIWDNVLKYLQVLSRPIALTKNQKPTYTPVYKDSSGLGMIMSVSLGVFGEEDLLGVAGTDILVNNLIDKIPQPQLGVFSHAFIINNNGFILVHPKFRPQIGYLPDPPNVYLDDIEYGVDPNDTANLKRDMIEGEKGIMNFPVYWLYGNNRKAFEVNITFEYKPVNFTEFGAATAINQRDEDYFNVGDTAADKYIEEGIEALYVPPVVNKTENYTAANFTTVQISKWDYCKELDAEEQKNIPLSMKAYPTAEELYTYLTSKSIKTSADITTCDKELLKRLVTTSAVVTKILDTSWNNDLFDKKINGEQAIESVYVATNGGYSKYFTYTNESLPFQRNVFNSEVYETATVFSDSRITVSTPELTSEFGDDSVKYLNVAGASRVGDDSVLAAVSGMKVSSFLLNEMLQNATAKITDKDTQFCKDNETHRCLVLDYNGFIVASNQYNEATGQFMGKYIPALTEHLSNVNVSIFKKVDLADTQAECSEYDKYEASSANILFTPFKLIISILSVLFNGAYATIAYLTMFLMSLITQLNATLPTDDDLKPKINISCTKTMPFYIFQRDMWVAQGLRPEYRTTILCETCKQSYAIEPIENTNLIFLIATVCKNRECLRYKKVNLEHTVNENEYFYTKEERYRKRPSQCFNVAVKDENTKCGAGFIDRPSIMITSLFLIISFLINRYT